MDRQPPRLEHSTKHHVEDFSQVLQTSKLMLYPACHWSISQHQTRMGGRRKKLFPNPPRVHSIGREEEKATRVPGMPFPPLLGSPSLLSWFARSFCFFLLVASSSPGGPLLGPVALAPPDILSRLVDSQSAPGSATASGSGLRRFLPGPAILATLCGQILQQGTDSLMRRGRVITTKGQSLLPGYTQGSAT